MGRWAVVTLAVLVIAGVAAVPTQSPRQAAAGIGVVHTGNILRQTPGFAAAESTFNAEMASYRLEVDRLRQQLDSAVSAFDQQSVMLSPTARQERERELQQMQGRLEQRASELQTKAQERQEELMAPLENRIQRVIEGLRAERNLAAIFDVGSPANNIVSADPSLDLTPIVINRLRSGGQ